MTNLRDSENSPHFVVKVTANGEWCMSLIDTGATISFVSLKYLIQHKIKTTKSAQPTAVRLGNGNIHTCTEHVDLDVTVEGHDCTTKCLVMPLPPGIDCILGMDWLNDNNVWLNPKTHRILFNADFNSQSCTIIEPYHVLNTEIPYAAHTTVKEQRGMVHACNMANVESDLQFVSTNLFNKMLALLKEGSMSLNMCNLMCQDQHNKNVETQNDTASLSYIDLCALDLNQFNPVTRQVILKERKRMHILADKQKHLQHVLRESGTNPEPELNVLKTHTKQKKGHKRKSTHTGTDKNQSDKPPVLNKQDRSGQKFIKSLCPKLRTVHKYDDLDHFNNDNESVWLAHISVLPDGTVYIDKNDPGSKVTRCHNNNNINIVNDNNTRMDSVPEPEIVTNKCHNNGNVSLNKSNVVVNDNINNDTDHIKNDANLKKFVVNDKSASTATVESEAEIQERWRNAVIEVCGLTNAYSIPTHTDKTHPPVFTKHPENINKTYHKYVDWVSKLENQEIEFFKCLEPLDKFVPLPTDKTMKVTLKAGSKPPPVRRYKCPINLLPVFKNYIKEMLEKGWIKPGKTEYTAPVLIIKKPGTYEDGSSKGYRFVCDMRGINAIVEHQQHYLPDITEMYEKLRDATFISVLDVRHGFWNAPVDESSKKYLGMSTPFGETFVWNVVPQGFINSSAHFQDFMERKLRKHGILYEPSVLSDPDTQDTDTDKHATGFIKNNLSYSGFTACYQDDIIVFSKNASDHKEHILKLLKILSDENIPLNVKKCNFFVSIVNI